jgi:hypothetical protein
MVQQWHVHVDPGWKPSEKQSMGIELPVMVPETWDSRTGWPNAPGLGFEIDVLLFNEVRQEVIPASDMITRSHRRRRLTNPCPAVDARSNSTNMQSHHESNPRIFQLPLEIC